MYDEQAFLELFGTDAFISVNKGLARNVGLVESVLFSELLSRYKYHKSNDQLIDGKWFYQTIETIEEQTTIKRDLQDKALKKLYKIGLVEKKLMGLPAKRYFAINITKLMSFYLEKQPQSPVLSDCGNDANLNESTTQTRMSQQRKLDSGNDATIITNNKNKNIKTNNKNKTTTSSSLDINSIETDLKEKYPNVPFDEVKEELLSDETAHLDTPKQYLALLNYRLKSYKPKKKKVTRSEILPDWFDESEYEEPTQNQYSEEEFIQKKAEIASLLEEFRK